MKRCVLFLHGRYLSRYLQFYTDLCENCYCVAVDGGYSFFRKTNIEPDLLIGDFDSLKSFPRDLSPKTEVRKYPTDKDQTDAHLALDYCVNLGAKQVDLVQPTVGETDQFLGNLMLLTLPLKDKRARQTTRVRIINHAEEIELIDTDRVAIEHAIGDGVSVLPLKHRVKYSCTGCQYEAQSVSLNPGDTLALRNRIVAERAEFEITGRALLIRRFAAKGVYSTGFERIRP